MIRPPSFAELAMLTDGLKSLIGGQEFRAALLKRLGPTHNKEERIVLKTLSLSEPQKDQLERHLDMMLRPVRD